MTALVRTRRALTPSNLIIAIACLTATILPFRGVFQGRYIGDSFDARWTTTVYEHWYLVLTGIHPLRETGIYYPFPNTLGLSDAFLLPGGIHSVLRVFGFSTVTAWSVTNLVLQAIFVAGLCALSFLILRHTLTRVIFILVAGSGYTWVAQLEHPQTLLYGLIVWIVVLFIAGLRTKPGQRNVAWIAIPPLIGLLALSAWYPFFFLVMLVPIAAIGTALLIRWSIVSQSIRSAWKAMPRAGAIASGVVFVLLMSLWAWIYLPVAGQIERTWDDYLMHAPTFIDFLGSNHLGGGIWGPIFDRVEWLYRSPPPNLEARVGLTPVLLGSFLLVLLGALATISRRSSKIARIELVIGWTVIVTWTLIAVDARGTSPFLVAWAFPGGDAIRSPMRVNVILSVLVLAGVLLILDRVLTHAGHTGRRAAVLTTLVIALFGSVLFVEQLRDDTARWSYSAEDERLISAADELLSRNSCESFRIEVQEVAVKSPDETPVLESLVSARSGVPTTGGYSGGFPSSHVVPTEDVCVVSWPEMVITSP